MLGGSEGQSFEIVARKDFSEATFLLEICHPVMAKAARPGQFVIVMSREHGERIPLTLADFDAAKGTVTLVIQAVGKTTKEMQQICRTGTTLWSLAGPMGLPSAIGKAKKVVCVGGGLGVAPVFPQARAHKEVGAYVIGVLGFRSRDHVFWEDRFRRVCDELILCTNDGSAGLKGLVTDGLKLALERHADVDEAIAIGPPVMMRACAEATKPRKIKTVVSLNPIMVDGTGMCGGCRVKIGEQVRFACVDGPEFDGHRVDFDDLMTRLKRFEEEEKAALTRWLDSCRLASQAVPAPAAATLPSAAEQGLTVGHRRRALEGQAAAIEAPRGPTMRKKRTIRTIPQERAPTCEQPPQERVKSFAEVSFGYRAEDALLESERCLFCAEPACVAGCPVGIDIPGFIARISDKDFRGAYDVITDTNLLPAVCGRVCPQENQCEGVCPVGDTLAPVAIGRLERFIGDLAIAENWTKVPYIEPNRFKVGIVGSGPAGIACAADMAKAGCDVTVYEAFHRAGGVLRYGIPDFRLPNEIIDAEIEKLARLGVKFECNTLVGRLFTVKEMIDQMGFDAVFIGTGAGYPSFLGVPGDTLNGVLSANELLTRCNLMRGREPSYDTPLTIGRRVAVIGAGNTAMDAARVCLRLDAEKVYCVYRRTRAECPARVEEVHHAEEEGIEFHWLTAPVEILGGGTGDVRGMRCLRMELGALDDSGRRRPMPVAGSEFEFEADMIVVAIGTHANPIIGQTSKLALDKRGYIEADDNLATSMAGVFAGGDIVTGAATVIEAMGAGRRAARSMKAFLGIRDSDSVYRPERTGSDGKLFGFDREERNFTRIRVA
jgi:homotetrameric NADPH-dependent glutamate synthase